MLKSLLVAASLLVSSMALSAAEPAVCPSGSVAQAVEALEQIGKKASAIYTNEKVDLLMKTFERVAGPAPFEAPDTILVHDIGEGVLNIGFAKDGCFVYVLKSFSKATFDALVTEAFGKPV